MFGTWTYLIFELGWAIPVVLLQWAVGRKALWARRRSLISSVLATTVYLSTTDGVAIRQGIWTLHKERIVGLYVVNVPLEEIVFFLLTNLMVIQTVLLLHRPLPGGLLSRLPSLRR